MRMKMRILAAVFAAMTAVGAFLRLPIGASSITLQFFFTLLSGLLLGKTYGALSQGVYVLLGLLGLPIFSLGGGLGYVLQPTFGFLLALPFCAWTAGRVCEKNSGVKRLIFAALAAWGVLYAVGVPYMVWILHGFLRQDVPFFTILKTSVLACLPADALKMAAAVVLSKRLLPLLQRQLKK